MAELEALLDRLAVELNRQVVLEGADYELVAYSRPKGEIDEVRVNSILSRHAPPDVRGHMESGGLWEECEPWRLDSAPELNMKPRLCVPVRSEGEFLGAMWMIDADESVNNDQLRSIGDVVPSIVDMVIKRCRTDAVSTIMRQDLFRRVMLPDGEASAAARRELIEAEIFEPSERVAVYVLSHRPSEGGIEANRAVERAREEELRFILEQCRTTLKTSRAGFFVSNGTGALLVGEIDQGEIAEQMIGMAETLGGSRFLVAKSAEGPLEQAPKLMRQAKLGLLVARSIKGMGPVVRWDDLGVYQVLSSMAGSEYLATALHPGLMAAITAGGNDVLLETLECYLDSGGSVKDTTEKLTLHRTSLYYRLERIEELMQVNVHDGDDRMALHIGLKLARLAGLYGGRQAMTVA